MSTNGANPYNETKKPFLVLMDQDSGQEMVKLYFNGDVWLGPGLSANAAAQVFWRAVGEQMPYKQMIRALQEHNTMLETRIRDLEKLNPPR